MKKLLILFLLVSSFASAQGLKQYFKYSTFYGAVNGGTSVSDLDVLVFVKLLDLDMKTELILFMTELRHHFLMLLLLVK